MSIKPPIKCPPDYSILTFRLTECKKAGIVKGIQTLFAMDLQELFVPVSNYEQRMITLRAGETKKIDVSGIGVHWPLNESYEVLFDPINCGINTEHSYSLYDESLNLLETITFAVTTQYPTYPLAFNNAVLASTVIKTKVFFDLTTFNSGRFTVTALAKDIKYRHVFSFDNTGFGGYQPFPFLHPGNLIVPKEKYPRERVKIMLVYPDYYKANVLAGCGCIDPSGDMKSNKKYVEYAFDDDVHRVTNLGTPIIAEPVLNAQPLGQQWVWQQPSTSHMGYHFKVGDAITASGAPNVISVITNINGYFFSTESPIGDLTVGQKLNHFYSPSTITWRKMGDFYLHTTAQDVNDQDYLYIETLWLRNPHQYDLPIKILLAS
jgi:hypothetical protein